VAGRLAEDNNVRILLIEAGPHNKDLENVHMVGGDKHSPISFCIGWSKNFDSETDWNLVTTSMDGVDGRKVKLSRGKFLGYVRHRQKPECNFDLMINSGSSGVNGTLCIRGCKQDYDDWKYVPSVPLKNIYSYPKPSRLVGRRDVRLHE
jgi:choline dehydrogenase-like flavoprotein